MKEQIKHLFKTAESTLQAFYGNDENLLIIGRIAELISDAFKCGNKVIIFGNGGSMCDAMHFAEELTGRFRKDRPALPAIALSDPGYITCTANDYGFEEVFARGVEAYAKPDDVVIGISTSGNSPNIINAIHKAQSQSCFTVALLGRDGGKLKGECDFELIVPAETTDRIQEMHIKIIHILIELIERELFPQLY
ncbi:MAG: D-sedoheptulose 7-phosphate isomerase [Candidatus Cloacimonetes bacterium]|nr:D-sedoheptulose 7-phosphate isomerase [Candidatus Cloacimonadota bacterium]